MLGILGKKRHNEAPPADVPLLDVRQVSKIYQEGRENEVRALEDISLTVQKSEFLCITGKSGAGKSTLLRILGCLERPTRGTCLLNGQPVEKLKASALSRIRNREIGFIFQELYLIPQLTALENVELPLLYRGVDPEERRLFAQQALLSVGLGERMEHRPAELSGGQQQMVAVARALVANPSVILADEPTGNLDEESGREVMRQLAALHRQGTALLLVTHDRRLAELAQRRIIIQDGRLLADGPGEKAGQKAGKEEDTAHELETGNTHGDTVAQQQ